jgi:hypothetical protein
VCRGARQGDWVWERTLVAQKMGCEGGSESESVRGNGLFLLGRVVVPYTQTIIRPARERNHSPTAQVEAVGQEAQHK